MFSFIKVNLTKRDKTVASFVTRGKHTELIKELIRDFNSKQVSNELAREYLKDCDVTIEDYASVSDFIKDILFYNGYLVDIEDEFDIAIEEEK